MKDKSENKTVLLQTKVSPEMYARLEGICQKYGYSIFKMLRMFSDCIVRFMDDGHNLSEDLLRIIRMFEGLPGWKKSICIAENEEDMEIVEAFYVLRSPNRDGVRLVHVERPFLNGDAENWIASYNIQRMLERFIELINPSLYRLCRLLGADLGTESLFDTIHLIANLYKQNPNESELRVQFENNDWHYGAKATQETLYQRRHFHSMDYIEQKSLFKE